MIREKLKWLTHEGESTNAKHGGGPTRFSAEVSVMESEGVGSSGLTARPPSDGRSQEVRQGG